MAALSDLPMIVLTASITYHLTTVKTPTQRTGLVSMETWNGIPHVINAFIRLWVQNCGTLRMAVPHGH